MTIQDLTYFAPSPKGVEKSLAQELRNLGARQVRPTRAGVSFQGPLETGYRACLWSRVASRILLHLTEFAAPSPEALYDGIRAFPWEEHLSTEGTLAVDFNVSSSRITHSQYGALKVKDAVVDRFRDLTGVRPSVDRDHPDLRINVYLHRNRARVSMDLSGESLHRRGYREETSAAPLKENLAAAILDLARWPEMAREGVPLIDPMCGSGTLVIEGALMAGDVAPGLFRERFGFFGWKNHDPELWDRVLSEARERRDVGLTHLPPIVGWDRDSLAVKNAWANVERAGLRGRVHIEKRALTAANPYPETPGLLVANPPYGERLGEEQALTALYARFGSVLKESFADWRGAVFTGNPRLGLRIGVRPDQTFTLFNGPIECRLLIFEARAEHEIPESGISRRSGGEMLADRLRKNMKNIGRWARKEGIDCYRLYDADLPEYALAVDLYGEGEEIWAHVQEYEAPKTIDPLLAEERLAEALSVIPEVLDLGPDRIFLKIRRRQKGKSQYGKLAQTGRFHEVREGDQRFLANFTDYLDTGLFLDHRITRNMLREMASGRRFLNLFGYTGTATVHAAAGGALQTITVDLSKIYLDWARRNLALNGFSGPKHELIQADCMEWLERSNTSRFGLIFLDPPTFSVSKRMRESFDVQRDHVRLIEAAMRRLEPGGVLVFSANFRRFRMDPVILSRFHPEEITRDTIPRDFARRPAIHRCWKFIRS